MERDQLVQDVSIKVQKEFMSKFKDEREYAALVLRRNIENYVYRTMACILHVKLEDQSYVKLVDKF